MGLPKIFSDERDVVLRRRILILLFADLEAKQVTTPLEPAALPFETKKMTIKESTLKTLEKLPEDVTCEDIQHRINFISDVRQ